MRYLQKLVATKLQYEKPISAKEQKFIKEALHKIGVIKIWNSTLTKHTSIGRVGKGIKLYSRTALILDAIKAKLKL